MHKSVLLTESIDALNIKHDCIIVDCTLGYGGHSSEILNLIPFLEPVPLALFCNIPLER